MGRTDIFKIGLAGLFIAAIMVVLSQRIEMGGSGSLLVIAAMIGGYMALNIGANDVANNVGPAVGSGALTMFGAIAIAAIFEAGGAIIAGGDVVGTIKKGIIDPALIVDPNVFIWLMMAALLAAAIWLNFATYIGAPVSTTHSIVGGVLGAGIAAAGWEIANWETMGKIATSWLISPLLGGVIAAGFLYLLKRTIIFKADKIAAAQRIVPVMVAVMMWAFSVYLILKGLKKIWKADLYTATGIGLAIAVLTFIVVKPMVKKASAKLKNDRESIAELFVIPLILSAAMLSFAHGANDVANAIGPLAAINDAVMNNEVATKAEIPLWVMLIGAAGIAIGLLLFGPKLIRTVGSEITELDKMRAFCVALAASITVIIASQLGLPVSSTHIAVGGIFGVGFLREYLESNQDRLIAEIRDHYEGEAPEIVEEFLLEFEAADISEQGALLEEMKKTRGLTKVDHKRLRKAYKKELVKRSMALKIAAAWVITVPAAGGLAALLYFTIRGIMLP
ncbi:MAG: inorganic phosphate transporter [Rhodobacteraceae bacterium]|nr:inorganic phosphate transporter [Paracoccaceae bacterium]